MTNVLEVRDLSVRFNSRRSTTHAVDRLCLSVAEREIVAVVGESGCGKSVSMMAILRLLPASAEVAGQALFDGVDLLAQPEARLREIRGRSVSVVFQEPMTSLNPVFTVGRQIGEVLRFHLGMSKRQVRDRTRELLELVHIPAAAERIDAFPHELSGGMRQRVMIAMALACEPKVLIADEPTTALDVTIQAEILELIRELRDRTGTAVILITHNLGVVAAAADRVVVMYAGRKVEEASVDALFEHPSHPYTIGLLGAMPRVAERLQEIPGHVPSLPTLPDECVFAPRCSRRVEVCGTREPDLIKTMPDHSVACFRPGDDVEVIG